VLIPFQHAGLNNLYFVVLFYDIVHDNIDVDLPLLDIVDPNVTHTRGHLFRIISNSAELMLY